MNWTEEKLSKLTRIINYYITKIFFIWRLISPKSVYYVVDKYKWLIIWTIFHRKIDRNQWRDSKSWENYNSLMTMSWEELESKARSYFQRLKFVVEHVKGHVLEIGCGIGNITKWIWSLEKVKQVIALDAFQESIQTLKMHKFPKVIPIQMRLENMKLEKGKKFDTIILCEIIEHIYPDEERKMLDTLRGHLNAKTAFIISTPIGWMSDAYHIRGFTVTEFKRHLNKYYGPPIKIDYSSGLSQIAFGYFKNPQN